jgi:hypothetical protein
MISPSEWRERVTAAARDAMLDWRAYIYMTAGAGGLCGVLLGAGMSVPFAASQSSTIPGRCLMGLFDFLVGSVAGGLFGSVVGGLFGVLSGLLGSPIMLGVTLVTKPNQSTRGALPSRAPSEMTPAGTPCGRGDESTPAARSFEDASMPDPRP